MSITREYTFRLIFIICLGLIIGFAPTIGPSLSGLLVDSVGWRAIFGIVCALACIIVLLAAKELVPYGEFRRTKFDALSVVLSTVGLVSLLYGLSSFSASENVAANAALIVFGLVVIGLYARRQLHLDEPMLRVGILATPQYRTVVIIALFQAALIGMETIMPLYIQGVLGHTATVSGIAMLPGAVIGAFTGLFAGRLFDKHGVRRPVLAGAAGITVGLIGFVSLQIDTPIVAVTLVYAVMVIGMQFTMTPVNTWGVNSPPNDAIQHAQSTSNTINQVAASFGTALLVSVAATVSANTTSLTGLENMFFGYHAAFCTTALLAGMAVVLIVTLVRDGKRAKAGAGATASRVVSVDVDTPLDVACGVLAKRKIKKVPVTRDGVLVGALSRRNILHAIITGEQPEN